MKKIFPFLILVLVVAFGCDDKEGDEVVLDVDNDGNMDTLQMPDELFREVPADESGILFTNKVIESAEMNYFTYEYAYNGGGVAIADINNDGLDDIYFTGNSVGDKLYINKGGLKFDEKDVSLPRADEGWHTGVTVCDINNDGLVDFYVCRSGPTNDPKMLSNLLYINQGEGKFFEQAAKYGIGDAGHSTMAAFFDYDQDGDQDLYVMNHPTEFKKQRFYDQLKGDAPDTDRLYRNDGNTFTDITEAAGVQNHAYGLGLGVADLTNDGLPDIYVANDYDEADFFYVNQGDGTFANELAARMKHISNFGMGIDIADFNNDGMQDLIELDMAFSDHIRAKRNMSSMAPEKFYGLAENGHHFQYMSNTLQMNTGNNTFVEMAQLAHVAQTDWSWAPLLADFDNDGWRDLYVTNGYKRDIRDRDFQNVLEEKIKQQGQLTFEETMELIPSSTISNQFFINKGDLTFEDVSEKWGLNDPYNSNGCAYSDLDNDGDLDLVTNNMEATASLFENRASLNGNNYLKVDLKGFPNNTLATSTKIKLNTDKGIQFAEVSNTKGYQSAIAGDIHFGLGESKIEKITVTWPDGKQSIIADAAVNQVLTVDYAKAGQPAPKDSVRNVLFRDISNTFPFKYIHQENEFDDFEKEILLPHRQSRNGPFFAVADVNADGLDDLYISGAKGISGSLLIQNANGSFGPGNNTAFTADKASEDQQGLFFDADQDGDLDLYVVSGGNDFAQNSAFLQDRLYLNDGKGNFSKSNGLPKMLTSGMSVASADIDGDGDLDLFVGGRLVPGHYPKSPKSYLLQNEGGTFTDVTDKMAPALRKCGMVNRCVFGDFTGDGSMDLAFTGEWNQVRIFSKNKGKFVDVTTSLGLHDTKGLWFALKAVDIDDDGDLDLIAGNLGMNNKFKASVNKPFNIYAKDFDDNGTWDVVLSKYQGEINYPVRGRDCTSEQMPFIAEKFPTFQSFAQADLTTMYTLEELQSAIHLEAYTFKTTVFLNDGDQFKAIPLPNYAQLSVCMDIMVTDVNNDGIKDLITVGNLFDTEVETVRYDAGSGNILLGDGHGHFHHLPYRSTGFFTPGNARNMVGIKISGQNVLMVGNNQQPLNAYLVKNPFY